MRRRWLAGFLMAMIAILALSTPAAAGGWATVEMEKPVTRVEAGEEMTLDFMLLQHGETPTDWTTPYLEATNTETGETLRVDATAGDETGRWTLTVTFPTAGSWDWAIQTPDLFIEDTFPALEVVGDAAVVSNNAGGITQAELDAAITGATEQLEKQVSSMTGEMDVLQKQITNLTSDRDILQKQIADLEAAQANQPDSSGTAWWVSALAGAGAALAVVGAGALFAMRRGMIRTRELTPATA